MTAAFQAVSAGPTPAARINEKIAPEATFSLVFRYLTQPFDFAQGKITLECYFTASFKVFEARNFGTRIAAI